MRPRGKRACRRRRQRLEARLEVVRRGVGRGLRWRAVEMEERKGRRKGKGENERGRCSPRGLQSSVVECHVTSVLGYLHICTLNSDLSYSYRSWAGKQQQWSRIEGNVGIKRNER
jgi:hypothetical protein